MNNISNSASTSVEKLLDVAGNVTDMESSNFTTATSTVSSSSTTISSTIPINFTIDYTFTSTVQSSGPPHHALVIFSIALFVAAVLLIVKVIMSHNKKRRAVLMGGSARWRLSASASSMQPGHPVSSAAVYTAMSNESRTISSMDVPLPESRLDWERQFFDESDYGEPTRDPEQSRTRLQLRNDTG